MGRPIKKKYFANTNYALDGEGVGGEQVATVVLSTTSFAVSTLTVAVSFSAPQITGGETATGSAVKTGNTVTSVTISNAGSGYTSAPTVSFTGTNMDSWQNAATATLTLAARQNGIAAFAFIPVNGTAGYISGTGGSSRVAADIVRQSGNKKYVVQTAQGVGACRLQEDGSAANAAGEMDITATDWNGSTYRVMKLHSNKARLKQVTESTAFLVADESWAKWTFSAATGTVVTIANN
tara:strand:+ start:102 stop:812 length:711 start_codon:yes stop_codon:yes gene_type:complete